MHKFVGNKLVLFKFWWLNPHMVVWCHKHFNRPKSQFHFWRFPYSHLLLVTENGWLAPPFNIRDTNTPSAILFPSIDHWLRMYVPTQFIDFVSETHLNIKPFIVLSCEVLKLKSLYRSAIWHVLVRPIISISEWYAKPIHKHTASWISNWIHTKDFVVITHPCPNVNGNFVKPPFKLEHGRIITYHRKQWMYLIIHVPI